VGRGPSLRIGLAKGSKDATSATNRNVADDIRTCTQASVYRDVAKILRISWWGFIGLINPPHLPVDLQLLC